MGVMVLCQPTRLSVQNKCVRIYIYINMLSEDRAMS